MPIYNISHDTYYVYGRTSKTLNLRIPGNVLVFFKTEGCPGCAAFRPVFERLSNEQPSIKYGVTDLTHDKSVVHMARQTTTEIKTVPYILFYSDERPVARYKLTKSNMNIHSLGQFIQQMLRRGNSQAPRQQGFMSHHSGESHSQATQAPKYYTPEQSGEHPGVSKNNQNSQYAFLNNTDEEDEDKLVLPESVIPHNVPWEGVYNKV